MENTETNPAETTPAQDDAAKLAASFAGAYGFDPLRVGGYDCDDDI